MLTVAELYKYYDSLMPETLSEEWDNDGLMVCADQNTDVRGVLFALDASEEVIEYAHNKGFNVVVTHHPLIFNKLSELAGNSPTSAIAIKALLFGVSVMSFHTRLDSVAFGVNNALAEKLGLESVCQLEDNHDGGSIGCIGKCKEQKLEDFCTMLKESLGSMAVNVAKGCDTVKKVAVVGGAGDDYLFKAVSKGADTFITGEVHHHIYMLAKSLGINIIGAGHHITEDPVLPVLAKKLNELDSSIDFEIYNSNPTFVI